MSEGIDVRVVIVHPGGAALLEACLDSLGRSIDVNFDVIVVANACHEPLPDLCEILPFVHVVRSDRAIGFSAANNLGVRAADAERGPARCLLFLNNDTVVEPDALRRLAEELDGGPTRVVAGPRLMIWRSGGYLNSLGLNVTRTGEAWDEGIGVRMEDYSRPVEGRSVVAVTGAALMIRSEEFACIGGWEEMYAFYFEDIDLCLRVRSHGWDVRLVPEAVIHHAISATAVRGSDMKIQLSWRNRFLLMAARWPLSRLVGAAVRVSVSQLGLLVRRLRQGASHDARLQVRAWLGAVRRLPAALRARRHNGSDASWWNELSPHGSVPEIVLPEPSDR